MSRKHLAVDFLPWELQKNYNALHIKGSALSYIQHILYSNTIQNSEQWAVLAALLWNTDWIKRKICMRNKNKNNQCVFQVQHGLNKNIKEYFCLHSHHNAVTQSYKPFFIGHICSCMKAVEAGRVTFGCSYIKCMSRLRCSVLCLSPVAKCFHYNHQSLKHQHFIL